jgi:hypothetical protein
MVCTSSRRSRSAQGIPILRLYVPETAGNRAGVSHDPSFLRHGLQQSLPYSVANGFVLDMVWQWLVIGAALPFLSLVQNAGYPFHLPGISERHGGRNPLKKALVKLCRKAPDLFARQNFFEQSQMIRLIELDAIFDGKTLKPLYKKPFDTLVEGLKDQTGGADETRTRDLRRDRPAF